MTPEQYEIWKTLVCTCKGNYQKSINIGSDKMRAVIIAVDEFLGHVAREKVEEKNIAVKTTLFSNEENRL